MDILLTLMYVIEFLVAALLILVILVQRSKAGGGLGGLATTSSGVEEAFGSDAGNVLVKVTVYLALVFAVNTIGIGVVQGITSKRKATGVAPVAENVATESADDSTEKPAAPAPALKTNAPDTDVIPKETTKPAETKPAETKPAETKPAETKPAETKPAEE